MKAYEYRHIVSFEETNVVGNVYYANHLRWQGRCREFFLREYAPGVLASFDEGFALATKRVSCEYLAELVAFDEIIIRMRLRRFKQNRITMRFDYWRCTADGDEQLVAQGEQEVAYMRRSLKGMLPEPVPETLRDALLQYQEI